MVKLFFDTNILIYFTINQDKHKLELARKYIFQAIEEDTLFISPMVLGEYILILSKYKVMKQHQDKVTFFSQSVQGNIDSSTVLKAYALCEKIDFCKNINDMIHIVLAEQYCEKLVTFDKNFKKLQKYTNIEITFL
jgi:predicted nucleic acid-binding protein